MARALTVIAAVAAAGLAAGGWWLARRGGPAPDPPRHTGEAEVNPMAAALIDRALDRVRDEPRRAEHRAALAMAYDANGLGEPAIEAYRQALEMSPDEPRWWYHLARAEAAAGRYDAALAAMDRAAALAPNEAAVHWRAGGWLLELGRLDEAAAAFERAAAVDRAAVAPRVGRARVHLARRDPDGAIAILEPLIRELPGAGYLHQLLGVAYQQAGRLPEATPHLARADGSPPIYPDPWSEEVARLRASFVARLQQADALAAAGRTGEALAILEPLRPSRPGDAVLVAKIGEVRMLGGDLDGAQRALKRALRLDETYHPAHLHLANVQRQRGDLGAAMRHVARALEIHPSLGPAHRMEGSIHLAASRWPAAEASLLRAIRFGAFGPGVHADLALARIRQGRLADAAATIDEALRRHPDDVRLLVLGGLCQVELGRRGRAVALHERAARLAPRDPAVQELGRRLAGGGSP